jgi:hypothetical protein
MPAGNFGEAIGGMPMVVELAAHPDDRAGLGRDRRGIGVALAVLSELEQVALRAMLESFKARCGPRHTSP